MAFTTRRGRPPREKLGERDHGTPETQFKRALGLTQEPIDTCLEQRLITPRHHWCGLHLRWLYTLRYGAPVTTTHYSDRSIMGHSESENPQWRMLREQEYRHAIALLQQERCYESAMRLCVFNEQPVFLNPILKARSWHEPSLAEQLNDSLRKVVEGLNLLELIWKTTHRAAPA